MSTYISILAMTAAVIWKPILSKTARLSYLLAYRTRHGIPSDLVFVPLAQTMG